MVEYHGTDPSRGEEREKFVRIDGDIYVGPQSTEHRDIAIEDGVLDRLNQRRLADPNSVDGGVLGYVPKLDGVNVSGGSDGLLLPDRDAPEARSRTVELVQKKNPSLYVFGG